MTVAALYIDPRGPYPKLLGPELCWDEARDARSYAGPWPVVSHPPCGPWGPMRPHCRLQDASLAPVAVEQVRRYGGVLEHPKGSALWAHCGMPAPGELPDAHGGRTIELAQVDYGHVARKRTWLYVVGSPALGPRPPARRPTHWCHGSHTPGRRTTIPVGCKAASAQQRRRTPVEFAKFLIGLAEQCGVRP